MLPALRRIAVAGTAFAVLAVGSLAASPPPPSLEEAVRYAQHDPGSQVDDADVAVALRRVGHDYGTRVDDADRQWLISWADRTQNAVQTALDQVGDPYRWGAAGPDAFDCSGLTLYAWRAGGVELPHNSGRQAGVTRSVAREHILPGDLVFFGDPIHHVAIYIGDGKVVDAPRSGYDVKVDADMMQRRDLVKVGRVL